MAKSFLDLCRLVSAMYHENKEAVEASMFPQDVSVSAFLQFVALLTPMASWPTLDDELHNDRVTETLKSLLHPDNLQCTAYMRRDEKERLSPLFNTCVDLVNASIAKYTENEWERYRLNWQNAKADVQALFPTTSVIPPFASETFTHAIATERFSMRETTMPRR
jgi:hypothetical protein